MAKLFYKKYGEGNPLIILHGLYGASDNWVSVARALMGDFSVYLLDMRNHGNSPHLPDHNYKVMTDDLVEFMNDHQIYSTSIIGHSMGGKLAMFLTALYPERIKKLIVVDISPRTYAIANGDNQILDHQRILLALQSVELESVKTREQVDKQLSKKIPSDRIRQFLLKNLKRNLNKNFSWKINLDVLRQNLPSILIGLEDEVDDLKMFLNPVLFIKGGDSNYIKKQDELLINDYFNNVKIKLVPEASHWVHAEKPEDFLQIIKTFLMNS